MLPRAPSHRLLIVTDAWLPQTNGVVRTLTTVVRELRAMGHVVEVIGPDRFRTIPCPTYSDIPLALLPHRRMVRLIEAFRPDALHIATEGPLGMAARSWAKRAGFRLHHRVPHALCRIPQGTDWHSASPGVRVDASVP